MDTRIVEFVEILRMNGLRVGASETVDAVRTVLATGVDDREIMRSGLQATLCKRSADVATFQRAFDLYFSGATKMLEGIDKSLAARIQEEGLVEGDDLKMIVWMLERLAGQMSPLADAMLQGDRAKMAQLFRNAALQIDFARVQNALQGGFFSRRLLSGAGGDKARSELESIAQELKARGLSEQGLEVVSRNVSALLRTVEDAARAEALQQIKSRLKPSTTLNEKQLYLMSREELEIVTKSVKSLALKLKARLVRRQRSRKKGTLNSKRTLRRNMMSGGVPMVPVYRARRPQRPDVVVLCDVSDSVRATSKLMLLFTYTLQSLFSRVRSFIFVSELGEVTKYFKDAKPEDAFDVVASGSVISVASNSDYGHALATFARQHLGSISRRTTVIVIGDGRNNFNPPNHWALDDIRRKAKRVVWIATEPQTNWGVGDSEMANYAKRCSSVVTVQTVADLERMAGRLIPT